MLHVLEKHRSCLGGQLVTAPSSFASSVHIFECFKAVFFIVNVSLFFHPGLDASLFEAFLLR